jgi:hypothetical protein
MQSTRISLTERLRDENPAQWQEFLALERQFCSAHGEPFVGNQREGRAKLDTLTTFFAVESSRKKFGMSLKDMVRSKG